MSTIILILLAIRISFFCPLLYFFCFTNLFLLILINFAIFNFAIFNFTSATRFIHGFFFLLLFFLAFPLFIILAFLLFFVIILLFLYILILLAFFVLSYLFLTFIFFFFYFSHFLFFYIFRSNNIYKYQILISIFAILRSPLFLILSFKIYLTIIRR